MITNYRPNRRRSVRPIKFLAPVTAIGLLYLLTLTPIFRPLERLVLAVARPLWSIVAIADEPSLLRRVEILERQLLAARLEHAELETLRSILGRPEAPPPKAIGRILARPPVSPYDTLIIDLGQSRVALGDVVVVEAAVVLGEIVEVYSTAAKVRLYSSPDFELAVAVGDELAGVLARGRGGGNFTLELPRDLAVATSTPITVLMAGRELVLAVVGDVDRTASDPFQYVYARLPVNLYRLKQVEIYATETFGG